VDNEYGRRDYGDRHGSCFDYLRPQFSDLGSGGWGTMILVGLIASVAAFLVSGMAGAFTARLRRGLESGDATGTSSLPITGVVFSTLGYVNAVLVVIAVGTMVTARFA
jgi:hypothetical protein